MVLSTKGVLYILKKYESVNSEVDTEKSNQVNTLKQTESTLMRSTRIRKVPEKYDDYATELK